MPPSVIAKKGALPDRLVWTDPDAIIPEMSWVELNTRVGRLAFCALAAALYPEGDEDRDAFCLTVFGVLIASGVDLDTADQMSAEVARVAGDDTVRDTAFDHSGEGLDDLLGLTGLQDLGHLVRSWLGLQTAEPSLEPYWHDDGDHPQGDVRPGAIGAETLKQILDMLDPTDFADYESYRSMLHAAHHATGGDKAAREVFLAWCSRNPDYGPGKRDQSGKPWAKSCAPCGIVQRSSGTPMRR